jgi:hypothetical protein
MELGTDSALPGMRGFPPAIRVVMKADPVLAVRLAALQVQRRVFLEDPSLPGEPVFEDSTLEVPKFWEAITAASCCAHASAELRRGIFKRAWRISSHRSFAM